MTGPTPAILLVADISGFTQFLKLHAISTSHARQIIVRLLDALVRSSRPPLHVAELEGDAVFFYALAEGSQRDAVIARVKAQIPRLFRAFKREADALQQVPMCVCDACTSIGNLRLKQVVHTGDVALERIDRFEKLFGLDVIVVHRMLKNTVPAREYLMLSDSAYGTFMEFYGEEPERRRESFEGVGDLDMLVFYETQLARVIDSLPEDAAPAPTRLQVLRWKLGMGARTIAGFLRPPGGRNPAERASDARS